MGKNAGQEGDVSPRPTSSCYWLSRSNTRLTAEHRFLGLRGHLWVVCETRWPRMRWTWARATRSHPFSPIQKARERAYLNGIWDIMIHLLPLPWPPTEPVRKTAKQGPEGHSRPRGGGQNKPGILSYAFQYLASNTFKLTCFEKLKLLR